MPSDLQHQRCARLQTLCGLVMLALLSACNRQTVDSPKPSQAGETPKILGPQRHGNQSSAFANKPSQPIARADRRKIEALLGPQALKGPPTLPTKRLKNTTIGSPKDAKVRLTGTARNAKLGAVVVTDSGEPWFIGGLDTWPTQLLGARVEVRGFAMRTKLAPDPQTTSQGAHNPGQAGTSHFIRDARWRAITPR